MSHWGLCQCHGIQGWELSQVQREGEEKDLQDFWELLIQEGLAETCRTQFADSSSGFFLSWCHSQTGAQPSSLKVSWDCGRYPTCWNPMSFKLPAKQFWESRVGDGIQHGNGSLETSSSPGAVPDPRDPQIWRQDCEVLKVGKAGDEPGRVFWDLWLGFWDFFEFCHTWIVIWDTRNKELSRGAENKTRNSCLCLCPGLASRRDFWGFLG